MSSPSGPGQQDPGRELSRRDAELLRVVGVVDGVLSAARALLHCELVALNVLDDEAVLTARVQGHLPGLSPGVRVSRTDTLCHLLVGGAPGATSDAPSDVHYAAAPAVSDLGLRSYVGVPVRDRDQRVVGTLCGFDREPVEVDQGALDVLQGLADVLTPYAGQLRDLDVSVARRDGRWLVDGVPGEVPRPDQVPEPASGAALAALLPGGGQARPSDEKAWLVGVVDALQRGTAARVEVEQAVGRVAERLGLSPLEAYRVLEQAAAQAGAPVDSAGLAAAERRVLRPAEGRPGCAGRDVV